MFSLFSFRADKSQFAPENISKYSNTLRITLLKKNGRRTPLNFNETIYAMKQAFPSVKVTVIDVTVDPFEHQIEILRSTTVLITPSGGISRPAGYKVSKRAALAEKLDVDLKRKEVEAKLLFAQTKSEQLKMAQSNQLYHMIKGLPDDHPSKVEFLPVLIADQIAAYKKARTSTYSTRPLFSSPHPLSSEADSFNADDDQDLNL